MARRSSISPAANAEGALPSTSADHSCRRILPAEAKQPAAPASPFTAAVDAYQLERRRGLRLFIGTCALAIVATTGSFLLFGWSTLRDARTGSPEYTQTTPRLPETESNFKRLLAENMMLKEDLERAENALEDLRGMMLRHSTESVAEEAKPSTPAENGDAPKAEPADSRPLVDEGLSGTTTTLRSAPARGSVHA